MKNIELLKAVTGEDIFKIEAAAENCTTYYWFSKYGDSGSVEYVIKRITDDQFMDMCKKWASKEGFNLITGYTKEKKHFCEVADIERLRLAIDLCDSESRAVLFVCRIILHRINMREEAEKEEMRKNCKHVFSINWGWRDIDARN